MTDAYTLGEGPCADAHRLGWPVLEPDLAAPVRPRWPAFAAAAARAGAGAILGFPLRVGAVRLTRPSHGQGSYRAGREAVTERGIPGA